MDGRKTMKISMRQHCRCSCSVGPGCSPGQPGSGRLSLHQRNSGHIYVLTTTARNWSGAHSSAVSRGGALARINDATENNSILTNLLGQGITNNAADGGNAIYVWVGGKETAEGTYGWIDRASNTTLFWTGEKPAAPKTVATSTGDGHHGRRRPGTGQLQGHPEPHRFRAGGLAEIRTTKIGQAGQWNDINGTDVLARWWKHAAHAHRPDLTVTLTPPTA